MIHTEFTQSSEDWLDYRKGKITASRIIDIMPGVKVKYRKERDNYMARLACEIITGRTQESYTNAAMDHGTETEPLARSAYEAEKKIMVPMVGFVDYDAIPETGASPDGLIYIDGKVCGGVEIKCPNTATHIQILLTGKIKPEYIMQMQFNMMCCNVRAWDFVSFDDRMPEQLQLYITTVYYDEHLATQIHTEVLKFKTELKQLIEKLKDIRGDDGK